MLDRMQFTRNSCFAKLPTFYWINYSIITRLPSTFEKGLRAEINDYSFQLCGLSLLTIAVVVIIFPQNLPFL